MRKLFFPIYLTICICSLLACTDYTSAELDKAEALLDDAQYEEAYALLDTLGGCKYQPGSRLQARYALLYTRALYKNYIVSPSDSLISLAVDYAEEHGDDEDKFYAYLYQGIVRHELMNYEDASVSLIRAMEYSEHVQDYYSTGQMYNTLCLINLALHCSDAKYYAWKSYEASIKGNLKNYAANALVLVASSHLLIQDYDSCRIILDDAIEKATELQDTFVLNQAYSLKAKYAICVDSLSLTEQLFETLKKQGNYEFSLQDYLSLATIYAYKGDYALAQNYLTVIKQGCKDINDSIQFYCNSYWVNRISRENEQAYLFQDTVLSLTEKLLSEGTRHTSIATQKDYAEYKLRIEQYQSNRKTFFIIGLSLLFVLIILFVHTRSQKRVLEIKLLKKTIKNLELEKTQYLSKYEQALQSLRGDDFLVQIKNAIRQNRGLSQIELSHLNSMFRERLPYFEQSLRELVSLSETEWQICMLLKLSFTPGEISLLLNKTPGAISSARIRMYNKVFHKKGHTNDWDDFIKSI